MLLRHDQWSPGKATIIYLELSLQYQTKERLPATRLGKSLATVWEGECEIAETGGSSSISCMHIHIYHTLSMSPNAKKYMWQWLHHPWIARLQHHCSFELWQEKPMPLILFANDSLTGSQSFAMILLLDLCPNHLGWRVQVWSWVCNCILQTMKILCQNWIYNSSLSSKHPVLAPHVGTLTFLDSIYNNIPWGTESWYWVFQGNHKMRQNVCNYSSSVSSCRREQSV